jgi:hypothetical protein
MSWYQNQRCVCPTDDGYHRGHHTESSSFCALLPWNDILLWAVYLQLQPHSRCWNQNCIHASPIYMKRKNNLKIYRHTNICRYKKNLLVGPIVSTKAKKAMLIYSSSVRMSWRGWSPSHHNYLSPRHT